MDNNINTYVKTDKEAETNNIAMTKKTISVSISEEILKKFNEHCEDNSINKSKLVEKLILKHMEGKR